MTILVMASWLSAAAFAVPQSPDTLVVSANHPPVWGSQPKLVEEVRIGLIDGDPAYTFGRVSGVAAGLDGTIWVADALAATIRRFTADGTHLGDVGRKGEGPGEFIGGMNIGIKRISEGRMAVFDANARRVSFFAPDGTYLSSWAAPVFCITSRDPPLVAAVEGPLYLRSCVDGADAWISVDLEGQLLDTIFRPPLDTEAALAKRLPFGAMAPYIPKTISALSPEGYYVTGRSDEYRLHRPLTDGRVVRIERGWEPISVLREERAQFVATYERRQQRFSQAGLGRDRPFNDIPRRKPPFWALHVDDDGRIWVARHQEGYFRRETPGEEAARNAMALVPAVKMEWREDLVTDVITPSGQYLGTLRFPNERTAIAATEGDRIWTIEPGEYDEQYVVRYRIDPGS